MTSLYLRAKTWLHTRLIAAERKRLRKLWRVDASPLPDSRSSMDTFQRIVRDQRSR